MNLLDNNKRSEGQGFNCYNLLVTVKIFVKKNFYEYN